MKSIALCLPFFFIVVSLALGEDDDFGEDDNFGDLDAFGEDGDFGEDSDLGEDDTFGGDDAFGEDDDVHFDPMFDPDKFEGDIVLPQYEQDHLSEFLNGTLYGFTRNAVKDKRRLWPKVGGRAIVPYEFARGHFRRQSDRQKILQAMAEYHRETCIQFRPRRTGDRGYIQFVQLRGCNSQVGTVGGMQRVSLGNGCMRKGTIIHELMHAVGFWHEQSRADRDKYVYIYRNNIQTGMAYNFDKYDLNKITHLGTEYDYCSVMHYPKDAFSKNGRATIVPRFDTRGCVLGSKAGFSKNDIYKIRKLYQCPRGGGGTGTGTGTGTGNCVDENASCPGWAAIGECTKNPGYMEKSCRKSCGKCSTTTTGTGTGTSSKCVDKNAQCQAWASRGECYKNKDYMHTNCARSCKTCGTTTTTNTNCKDIKDCGSWVRGGYCTISRYESYMAKNCKKSCGYC